jgi:hypothetical protein
MAEQLLRYHEDVELFRDALRFTAAETEFSERLIETDMFAAGMTECSSTSFEHFIQ